jgi:adenylosuccinate synthase
MLGDALDQETDFRWVIDSVAIPTIEANPSTERWLFDSVRKHRQLKHFRTAFPGSVLHAHLTAPESVLRDRFEQRRHSESDERDAAGYDSACSHPNELEARSLQVPADVVVVVEGKDFESILKDVLAKYEGG